MLKEILGYLTCIVSIAAAAAAGTWYIRADYMDELKNRIEVYEKSDHWKLPETLKKLNDAANNFSLNYDEKKRLVESEKQLKIVMAENTRISKELTSANIELLDTKNKIALFVKENEEFTLKSGDSHPLFKNEVYVALKIVNYDSVSIILNNASDTMYVGESKEYNFQDIKCKLVVLKVETLINQAKFVNICY